MKDNHLKRLFALALAVVMLITLCPVSVFAAEAQAEGREVLGETSDSYEPWKHGYRLVDILEWSAETDDYADELRASVPLQERNAAFAATQANPNLTTEALVYNVAMGNYRSTDTAEAPWNGYQYYDDFSYNVFKFWQYTDFIGAGGRPTTGFDSETALDLGTYEYGVVGIPLAAFTNAAHKNGVMALAEYFIPRNPQYTEEWLYKDENGNFPYGQKLVDLMNYYGFDGYFINQEGAFDASLIPLFKEMLAWMREQGVYIQWYDSIADDGSVRYLNEFADYDFATQYYPDRTGNYHWVLDETYGRVSDSMWLNYWWNATTIDKSVALAEKLGLDPYEALFLGIECGYGRFEGGDLQMSGNRGELINTSNSTVEYLDWVLDENGNPKMSFALWGGDFVHEGYKIDNKRYTPEYQWISEERERMWYTSAKESVTDHAIGMERPDVEVGTVVWQGLSKYVAERSAINGSVFTTNFNTGKGMQYFRNGAVSRDVQWSNVNLQDFMPTWQWWVETEGTALNLEWDYGPEQERVVADTDENGNTIFVDAQFDYTQVGAYNGGSSLAIYGDLKANEPQYIHLYKTDLAVTADSKLSVTYNKVSENDSSTLYLGLIFKDDANTTVLLPIENSGNANGWTTGTVSLAKYAGREIAAMSVQIQAQTDVTGYQINLGRLSLTDGASHAPAVPEGFEIDKVFDTTGEITVRWELADYETVKLYEIYAVYADGTEKFVTGAYADNLYIETLEDRENIVGFNLYAIGADGSASAPAFAALNTAANVSNIRTVSADGKLVVTWDEPEADFDSVEVALTYFYSDRTAPATVTVDKGVKTAVLDIGIENGDDYLLTVTTRGQTNSTASYFGDLANTYSYAYDGQVRIHQDGDRFSLTIPATDDWNKLHLTMDGVTSTYARTSTPNMYDIRMPEGLTLATVTVEDLFGNMSEAVAFRFVDGELADMDAVVADEIIPDPVLREALFAQAGGNTYADLAGLSGVVDLSGLEIRDLTGMFLLVNVTDLDISNTLVTDLSPLNSLTALKTLTAQNTELVTLPAGALPTCLEFVDLCENTKLTCVEAGAVAALGNLTGLNLANCTALTQLYLDDTNAIEVNITGCTELAKLVLTGTQMEGFRIAGLNKLVEVYANNAALAILEADEASAYTALQVLDLSGSRFDLSDNTPERALLNGLTNTELSYGGQTPEIFYAELPEVLTLALGSEKIRTMDYFENVYRNATTVRGTTYSTIVGSQWLAQGYDAAGLCAIPAKAYAVITDEAGNYINEPQQPGDLVDYETNMAIGATVLGTTPGYYTGEEPQKLFDGSYTTKWCVGRQTGYTAFYTQEPVSVGRWVTVHAQANNEPAGYNTVDYELQILNTEAVGMSEADFLASASATDAAVLADDANWTTVAHISDNTAAIVEQELETAAPTAQVYRLKVNNACLDATWGYAIRFQEIELYAADNIARDYDGYFTPDTVGTYEVTFRKGLLTTFDSMTVVVEDENEILYEDVADGRFYTEAIYYVTQRGIMQGIGDNKFAPEASATRGQVVTMLYRLAGEPAVTAGNPFSDVAADRFFYDAVIWASQHGITKGVTDTTFCPDDSVTREEIVTFLYRYAQLIGLSVNGAADLTAYTDADSVSNFARTAMAWAVECGIITGMTETTLVPKGTATRGQIATIFARFMFP